MLTAENKNRLFAVLSMDITNHCNARCVFCLNDWEKIRPHRMERDTLERILPLLPLFEDKGVYFSCIYEPSIHPEFIEMLSMLPEIGRDKAFFTSNFIWELSDEKLSAIVDANISHVNISLETYNPERYEYLTGGVGNSHFYENIRRLAQIQREKGRRVIRVVSMLLSSNYDEMIDLITRVHDELDPIEHEIRTPYFFDPSEKAFELFERELLSRERIDEMKERIDALGYDHIQFDGTMDLESFHKWRESILSGEAKAHAQTEMEASNQDIDFYTVRINANGKGEFVRNKEAFDIGEIADPEGFMRQHLLETQAEEAIRYLHGTTALPAQIAKESLPSQIDEAVLYDGRFLYLRGWELFCTEAGPGLPILSETPGMDSQRILSLTAGEVTRTYLVKKNLRPDVAQAFDRSEFEGCGFEVLIDLRGLPGEPQEFDISIGIMKKTGRLGFGSPKYLCCPVDTIQLEPA